MELTNESMAFKSAAFTQQMGNTGSFFFTKEFIWHVYELLYSNIKISGKNDLCIKKNVFVVVGTKVLHYF